MRAEARAWFGREAACEVNFIKIYWVFIIIAIACALFSDKIDTAVKADGTLKKVIVIFSVGVLLVCTIAIIATIL